MSEITARDRMLESAIRLFRINGIQQTGVDLIIAESGSARGTLYSHFGSKSGLVAAALEEEGRRWRAWFFGEIERRSDVPREQLLTIFNVLAKWFREKEYSGCLLMNAVVECRSQDEVVRETAIAHKREVNRRVARMARAAGAMSPRRLTQQIDLLVDGLIVTALVTRSDAAVKTGRLAAESLVLGALEEEAARV